MQRFVEEKAALQDEEKQSAVTGGILMVPGRCGNGIDGRGGVSMLSCKG